MKYFAGMASPRPFSPPGSSFINSGIGAASACQIPERSGLPFAARGAGAERFGFPFAVRGVPGTGYLIHWPYAADVPRDSVTANASAL